MSKRSNPFTAREDMHVPGQEIHAPLRFRTHMRDRHASVHVRGTILTLLSNIHARNSITARAYTYTHLVRVQKISQYLAFYINFF